jgi:hypothetical protein
MIFCKTHKQITARPTELLSMVERFDVQECSSMFNSTGYDYPGGENFEHDDTGSQMNFSGCYDLMLNPISVNEGWQEGYDY